MWINLIQALEKQDESRRDHHDIAEQQAITVSGSGKYRAADLPSESANVQISGSGDATLWVIEILDIVVSGSGNVDYYGAPQVNQRVSGSGNVRSLGNK